MPDPESPKNWIFAPGQDFQPGGALRLGQVLENWRDPASGLIPKNVATIPVEIYTDQVTKSDINMYFQSTLSKSFSAYCEAKGLPVGADAGQSGTENSQSTWNFYTLNSTMFQPGLEYCKTALKSGDVPSKTQWWKLRRRIFLVTGLRIARGGSKSSVRETTSQANARAEADGEQANVPARAGAQGERETSDMESENTARISAFIWAYRLEEITYRLWVSHKPIGHGHTASREDGDTAAAEGNDDEEDLPEPEGYDLVGLDGDPFEGEDDPDIVE